MPLPERAPHAPDTAERLLLAFLSEHDAPCPVCGYNLRGLASPACPECRQDLALSVGAVRVRLRWLFTALAPCFFSGIAACFVVFPTIGVYLEEEIFPVPLVFAVLFGWVSGLFSILLAIRRERFLALSLAGQRWFAAGVWAVHAGALALFVLLFAPYWS